MKRFGISLGIAFVLAGFVEAAFPVTQRLTSPLACPPGTVESIVTWRATDEGSEAWLYCIDADGGGVRPSSALVFFTMVGYAVLVTLIANLGLYLATRRKLS